MNIVVAAAGSFDEYIAETTATPEIEYLKAYQRYQV